MARVEVVMELGGACPTCGFDLDPELGDLGDTVATVQDGASVVCPTRDGGCGARVTLHFSGDVRLDVES